MKEILIKSFIINDNIIVTPVGCPIPDSSEITKKDGQPVCVYNEIICPYLSSVNYNMKESAKVLFCNGGE